MLCVGLRLVLPFLEGEGSWDCCWWACKVGGGRVWVDGVGVGKEVVCCGLRASIW